MCRLTDAYQVRNDLNLQWQGYAPEKEIRTPTPPPPTTKVIPICRLFRWHKKHKPISGSWTVMNENIKIFVKCHLNKCRKGIFPWHVNDSFLKQSFKDIDVYTLIIWRAYPLLKRKHHRIDTQTDVFKMLVMQLLNFVLFHKS